MADNSGAAKAALRVAEAEFSKPDRLTTGLLAEIIRYSIVMKHSACRLNGTGLASWLLEVDRAASTIKLGASTIVDDPAAGYCYIDGLSVGQMIEPVQVAAHFESDCSFVTEPSATTLTLPVFMDSAGQAGFVLPIHAAAISEATISSTSNCIGSYRYEEFWVADKCSPTGDQRYFATGARLDGFLLLSEIDEVEMPNLSSSLCGVLLGSESEVVDQVKRCKRDSSGHIVAQGDWCSATNAAATAGCHDALQLSFTFAASAVKVNGVCD